MSLTIFRYLFQRNTVRPQNNNANPMLGQSSPLYQRKKSDQQITSGLRPDVDASANWNAGTGNANLPPVNYPSGSYYGGGAYHYGGGAFRGWRETRLFVVRRRAARRAEVAARWWLPHRPARRKRYLTRRCSVKSCAVLRPKALPPSRAYQGMCLCWAICLW